MEHILNEYCKQFNPGLLLLSMPTGSGKTYKVLNFIYSNYEEFTAKKRKIWFITNLKKNLPINELKERFIADGKEDEFDKHVLFIDSNVDTIINRLLQVDNEIPDQYKTKDYSDLKNYIEILQNSQLPKTVKYRCKTEIRKNLEPKFREIIKKELDNNFKTKKARLSAIKNDRDYQWIGKLYPAVFTDEKTILFLSIDKFVSKNTTLIEPSYYFNQRLINEPLIFIEAQNRASHRSNQTSAYIHSKLNTPWTSQSVKVWQDLREQVLRQPAIAKESECNPNWNSIIYLKLPKAASSYRYLEEYDYREIEVFFSDGYGKKEVKEVSERTARLSDLMRIDILHKLFIDSGWTTAFPESELMLTPPIFNNIYKGVLGEVCGKHIFQSLLNIDLLELDVDEFERFDFKTEQNIYIDFKLWNDQVAVPADELIDKIREKMAIAKADRVFVINILGTSNTAFHPIISTDIQTTPSNYGC